MAKTIDWVLLSQYADGSIGRSTAVAEELDRAVSEQYSNTDLYVDTAKRILEAARVDIVGGARDLSVVTDPMSVSWAIEYLWSNIW